MRSLLSINYEHGKASAAQTGRTFRLCILVGPERNILMNCTPRFRRRRRYSSKRKWIGSFLRPLSVSLRSLSSRASRTTGRLNHCSEGGLKLRPGRIAQIRNRCQHLAVSKERGAAENERLSKFQSRESRILCFPLLSFSQHVESAATPSAQLRSLSLRFGCVFLKPVAAEEAKDAPQLTENAWRDLSRGGEKK